MEARRARKRVLHEATETSQTSRQSKRHTMGGIHDRAEDALLRAAPRRIRPRSRIGL
jgi:hypothetical protein